MLVLTYSSFHRMRHMDVVCCLQGNDYAKCHVGLLPADLIMELKFRRMCATSNSYSAL